MLGGCATIGVEQEPLRISALTQGLARVESQDKGHIYSQGTTFRITPNGQCVAVGNTVLVRGYEKPAGSGMVLATRLVRLPPLPSMDVAVRGPFTASTATQFKILGITIDATSAKLYGTGGQSLTTAEFFTQAAGQVVDVLGTASGSTVTASKAIIDPLEDH